MHEKKTKHARLALFWSVLGVLSTLAVFPYNLFINPSIVEISPFPLPVLAVLSSVQVGIMLFFGCWLALRVGQRVRLDSPIARAWVYGLPRPEISITRLWQVAGLGLVIGLIILGLDKLVFQPLLPEAKVPIHSGVSAWVAFLASFYGGITEELLLRLIVMTLLTWLIARVVWPRHQEISPVIYWFAITIAALLFALGHLPATAVIWDITPLVFVRMLVLNMIGGIPFGYLYWRKGLEYAMVAHFCADIGIHVIGGR